MQTVRKNSGNISINALYTRRNKDVLHLRLDTIAITLSVTKSRAVMSGENGYFAQIPASANRVKSVD